MGERDVDLLRAWADGDDEAGRAFYRRYATPIAEFIGRKVDGDAADLVQRTFMACLEAAQAGRAIDNPRAFAYRVARNEIYDYWKARRRDAARFDPYETSLRQLGTSPTSHFARGEQGQRMLRALEAIPLESQIALELFYWEELSMAEVAEALGVTRTAALSRVHRARQQVRDELTRQTRAAARAAALTALDDWIGKDDPT